MDPYCRQYKGTTVLFCFPGENFPFFNKEIGKNLDFMPSIILTNFANFWVKICQNYFNIKKKNLKSTACFFIFLVCPWPDPSFSPKKTDDAQTQFGPMLCTFCACNEVYRA